MVFFSFLLFLPEIISEMETFQKCSNTSKTMLESFREQESIFGEDSPRHTRTSLSRNEKGSGIRTRLLLLLFWWGASFLLTTADV